MTTLSLRDWSDPTESDEDADGNGADDPDRAAILYAVIAEYNGENDTAEISCGTDYSGDDSWRGKG